MGTVDNSIRWDLLHETADYFQYDEQASNRGRFKFIDVPWVVSERAIRSTFNGNVHEVMPGQFAVGSAEQSFAELLLRGDLDPKEQYVAISPCFRDEPVIDWIHKPHFIKAELIQPYQGGPLEDFDLAVAAAKWMDRLVDRFAYYGRAHVNVIKTNEGYDVTVNKIEVGSYGIRHFDGFSWVYGTALAEPRFSTVLHMR